MVLQQKMGFAVELDKFAKELFHLTNETEIRERYWDLTRRRGAKSLSVFSVEENVLRLKFDKYVDSHKVPLIGETIPRDNSSLAATAASARMTTMLDDAIADARLVGALFHRRFDAHHEVETGPIITIPFERVVIQIAKTKRPTLTETPFTIDDFSLLVPAAVLAESRMTEIDKDESIVETRDRIIYLIELIATARFRKSYVRILWRAALLRDRYNEELDQQIEQLCCRGRLTDDTFEPVSNGEASEVVVLAEKLFQFRNVRFNVTGDQNGCDDAYIVNLAYEFAHWVERFGILEAFRLVESQRGKRFDNLNTGLLLSYRNEIIAHFGGV